MTACHRTGFGFDSHAFGPVGTLVLGGRRFDGTPALKGHSDGDALLHAAIDALLGAAGLGDIGELFPDSDPRYKDADSGRLFVDAVDRVRRAGFAAAHLDVTVVADRPRLSSAKAEIREGLARALGLPVASVNVKAKTQEGLTWFGADGGIAVWAVATITSADDRG